MKTPDTGGCAFPCTVESCTVLDVFEFADAMIAHERKEQEKLNEKENKS